MLSHCYIKQIRRIFIERRLGFLAGSVLLFILSACIPKRNPGASLNQSPNDGSPLFTIVSFKVGGSYFPSTDSAANYYSKYDPITIAGVCRGSVETIRIEVTPLSSSTTTEVVNCNATQFSWSKSLTTQTSFTLVFTPLSSEGTQTSGLTAITKNYIYDITNPAAPTFLTPTTGTTYSVANGQTQFTITGQVLNEVAELMGPEGNITLAANGDGIHQDFSYSVSIPVGTSTTANFVAYDYARNTASSSMTITSILGPMIPVASMDAGGSVVIGGLVIHSNAGYNHGVSLNTNIKFITGTAGIVGNNP